MSKDDKDDELTKIDALIAQHSEVFEGGPQLRYSKAVKYGTDQAAASKGAGVPHGGYRCHRCGEAGHYIQDCPMGEDGKGGAKVRQARGIPKAFLETVSELDAAKAGGAFVSAEGGLVVMKSASKDERLRLVGPSIDVELQRSFGKPWEDVKKSISCFLCSEVARMPVSTTCCGELFCKECIFRHLDRTVVAIDDDALECPNCDRKNLSTADVVANKSVGIILARLAGSVDQYEASASRIRSHRPAPTKKLRTSGADTLDIDIGDVIESSEDVKVHEVIVKRHPNTILVPGGQKNPFFEVGAPLLTEGEFKKWKLALKKVCPNLSQQQ